MSTDHISARFAVVNVVGRRLLGVVNHPQAPCFFLPSVAKK